MYRFNIKFWLMVLVCGEIIVYRSGADDYYYETCVPKSCGDGRNISYPFYIVGLQEPFCGMPGFNLTCDEAHGHPLLRTPENDFIVGDINYRNSSARLKNAAVENSSCAAIPGLLRNVTLDDTRYQLFDGVSPKLVLLSNCKISSQIPEDIYKINQCGGGGGGGEYYMAMLENDTNLLAGKAACDSEDVVVPIDPEQVGGGRVVGGWDFEEVVKRGFLIKFLASNCSECYDSGGRCGFDEKNLRFQCYCPDRPHYKSCSSRKSPRVIDAGKDNHRALIIVSVTVGSVIILACLCLVIFVIRRRYKHMKLSYRPRYLSWKKSTRDLEDGSVYFGVPVFSCAELEQATNNFDPLKELGDGGFGTVYYGKLRDGREVAVKRLYENNYKRVEHFKNEVDILTRLRHPNLVLLYGCTSRRSRELLLVYEYIPNGTVADHLHGERAKSSSLTWPIRMNIAIETASGLAYLHASEIIHRDVKTNNILLDENFNVKVADFGLSRLWPNDVSHISTAPQGTPGYVDPEYHQCYQLTDKSDVYSFGVVLIELISSMPAVDISRQRDEINLSNLAINRIQRGAFDELMDPNLGFKTDPTVERATMLVAELAFRCLQFDKESRPTMKEALEILKEIQGEESSQEGRDSVGELTNVKPPHSPETEEAVLLKTSTFPPSPISVTDKWYSSRSTTPSASGGVE